MKDERDIILNRIQTPDGTILTSHHRHDYKTYTDANGFEYMVDGGQAYLRRNLVREAPHKELSVYSDEPFEVIREAFYRGGRGKDGKQPLTYVALSQMSDAWVMATIEYLYDNGYPVLDTDTVYHKELIYRKERDISVSE